MLGIGFALAAAVFIALFQIAARKSYQQLRPSVAFLFDALFGLMLWVPLALFMGVSLADNLAEALVFALISAVLSEAIVFYALSKGELGVTVTVLATYPVYTVILSRFINNEVLSVGLMVFVGCAILGSLVASWPDEFNKEELRLRPEVVWPFVAAVCIGLSDTLSKGFINRSGDFSLLFALGFVQVPVALAYLKLDRQSVVKAIHSTGKQLRAYKMAVLGGLLNIIGTGFLWLSFYYAPASIASPVTGASGALTVMMARFAFRERLSLRKHVGIALTFVGVIGVAILRS